MTEAGPLKDHLPRGARVLFVGINPGLRSGALGHHFAGKGNPFWRLLHAAGLTPALLAPEEDYRLPELGLGLTNLCPRTTRTAAELTAAELADGRRQLAAKIRRTRPRVVAFVGLSIYQGYFGHRHSGGPGAKPERIHGAAVFVVPNPSGLNASFPGFSAKLEWFAALRRFADEQPPQPAAPAPPADSRPARDRGRKASPRVAKRQTQGT